MDLGRDGQEENGDQGNVILPVTSVAARVLGFYDILLGGWLGDKSLLASFRREVSDVLAGIELRGPVFCQNFKREDRMISFRTSQKF